MLLLSSRQLTRCLCYIGDVAQLCQFTCGLCDISDVTLLFVEAKDVLGVKYVHKRSEHGARHGYVTGVKALAKVPVRTARAKTGIMMICVFRLNIIYILYTTHRLRIVYHTSFTYCIPHIIYILLYTTHHLHTVCTRSGELRTQKLKSHLVRTQSLNVLPFKPGVGQYI